MRHSWSLAPRSRPRRKLSRSAASARYAIKRADSVDTTKVRDALDAMNGFDAGIYGPVKWTGKDFYGVNRQLMFTYYLAEVKGGKLVTKAKFQP